MFRPRSSNAGSLVSLNSRMPRDTLTAPGMWLVWYSSASRTSSSTSAFLMASSAWSSGISRISARAASTRSCAVFIGSLLKVGSRQVLPPVLHVNLGLDGIDHFQNQGDQRLFLAVFRQPLSRVRQEHLDDIVNKSMVGGRCQVFKNLVHHIRHDITYGIFQGVLNGGAHHRKVFQAR